MPVMQSRELLREQIVALLPADAPMPYKEFQELVSSSGLGEGWGELNGMKLTGQVDRWLETDQDGKLIHLIARPGVRSQG